MKQLSIHRPLKQKLTKSNNFEYYLAGLIDGDGHINYEEFVRMMMAK